MRALQICRLSDDLPNTIKYLVFSLCNPRDEYNSRGQGRALWFQLLATLLCILYPLMCGEEKVGDFMSKLFKGK